MQIVKPVWWVSGAAGIAGYVLFMPKDLRIPCLFNYCTGLQCPGCGTTRALTALLQGDLVSAFNFNQLIWFIPIFILAYELTKKSKYRKQIHLVLTLTAVSAALGFFLVRNHFI